MKKTMMILLSVVLVAAISVAGTLAYLTDETEPVVNTFIAGGYVKNETLKLREHNAVEGTFTGEYTLGQEIVDKNKYIVVPGVTVPKDPFVTVDFGEAKPIPSYLYVEIVDNTGGIAEYQINDSLWTKLEGAEGPNGGSVFSYNSVVKGNIAMAQGYILKDNQVKFPGDVNTGDLGAEGESLDFYAYMTQESAGETALAAWNAEFAPAPPTP